MIIKNERKTTNKKICLQISAVHSIEQRKRKPPAADKFPRAENDLVIPTIVSCQRFGITSST